MKTNQSWLGVRPERSTMTSHSKQEFFVGEVAVLELLATVVSRARGPEMDGGVPGPYPVGHTSFVSTTDFGRPVAVNLDSAFPSPRVIRETRGGKSPQKS